MEDVRIGRKIVTTRRFVSVGGAAQQIVIYDPKRVSLSIFGSQGLLFLGFDANVISTGGFSLPAGDHGWRIDIWRDGDCVTRDWWAFNNAVLPIPLLLLEGHLDLE